MYQFRTIQLKPVILAGMLAGSSGVSALQVEPGVGAGLLYTDNAALTANNEDDDLVIVGYLGAEISENDGPFTLNATMSLLYTDYTEDTFSDQYYVNNRAIADWVTIRDRLDWRAEDYFTQRQINSLDANTPDNNQDTNVFSFGPNIYLPISGRQMVTVRPEFQDFYYEESDIDNRRYRLSADWRYQLNQRMATGLDGTVTWVDYDDENRNPNYTATNIFGTLSGTGSRSDYFLNLGATYINRDKFDNQNGFSGNLTWLYQMTARSTARAFLSSSLTDSSQGLLNSAQNPDDGDFNNEQISGDVLRNNTARITFSRQDSTLGAEVWGEFRELSYKESSDDRDVQEAGARLEYRISPLITTGINGRYNRTNEQDTKRRDKRYTIGANLDYQLSRKLRAQFDVQYRDRDSTESNGEYSEFSTFISLVYGFQDLTRPGRGGGAGGFGSGIGGGYGSGIGGGSGRGTGAGYN